MNELNNKIDLDWVREQLEEFALHLKPGTTKGKHRTAIFDTLELAKLVQSLITEQVRLGRIDELKGMIRDAKKDGRYTENTAGGLEDEIEERIAQLKDGGENAKNN